MTASVDSSGTIHELHREFYQILEYKGDVDLHKRPKEWEDFYNYYRPHSSLKGKTPYEILRERLK